MSKAFILSARKMIGSDAPTVRIPLSSKTNNSAACVAATQAALEEYFMAMLQVYNDWRNAANFRLEDVINYVTHRCIDDLIYYTGIDVVYTDKTIHIRFGLFDEDMFSRCGSVIDTSQFTSRHLLSNVDACVVRSAVTDKEEYWDYTFDIK